MKKIINCYEHFVEKYKIYFFIELLVCLSMCGFKLYEYFHHHDVLYLFPASYFLLYIILKTILEILLHKRIKETKYSIIVAFFIAIINVAILSTCFLHIHVIPHMTFEYLTTFIIYASYTILKFVIVIIKYIKGLVRKDQYEVASMRYAICGVTYTTFIFSINLISRLFGEEFDIYQIWIFFVVLLAITIILITMTIITFANNKQRKDI